MQTFRTAALSLMAAAVLAACGTTPVDNFLLTQARNDYRAAQADAQTQALATNELRIAGEALNLAEAASVKGEDVATIDQLAYLARQRTALARETARRKGAEAAVAQAGTETANMRLAARTREADAATAAAGVATRDAAAATRDAEASQRQAGAATRDAARSQQQAALSQQQVGEAERRNALLQTQLRELNAKETERGLVITIGDVLFATGQATLRSDSLQSMQRLSGFLKQYPQRKALIEGYTDSVGGDSMNIALSARRAEAVMGSLLGMGVNRAQLTAQGLGESSPVAPNDSADGRRANRRVEIVLSDENGALKTR
ncbi:flagellar motor protein MotB [beta proteobacterium AAP51]|nr:flagellar motor protein MotB [beta proteobacterium AAP51]